MENEAWLNDVPFLEGRSTITFADSFEQLVECLQYMYNWKILVTKKQ